MTTRWSDNDMYGHLNNAVYYELFDSAINGWQAEHVTIDPMTDATQGVVAESSCAFYAEVAFPAPLVVGVRVVATRHAAASPTSSGSSSTRSAPPRPTPRSRRSGTGCTSRSTPRRGGPTPIPDHLRALMETAVVEVPEASA